MNGGGPAQPAPPIDRRQSETANRVAKGVRRMLRHLGYSTVTELSLANGRRADIVALASDGSFTIIEVKSSTADFRADMKWPEYRLYCDRLYFAIPDTMSPELIPMDVGLMIADGYGAELVREAPEHRLAGAARRALLVRFAQAAADRLHTLADPEFVWRTG